MSFVIAPSILSANFANLEQDIAKVEAVGCNFLHIDVMDGHFVPNITIGVPVVASLRKITTATLDAHLMIDNPLKYAPDFAKAGADIICVHIETLENPTKDLEQLKNLGTKIGLALNPDKDFSTIKDYVSLVDMVLIMSVFPGFGGQSFIEETLNTVKQVKEFSVKNNLSLDIQIDGGINKETIKKASEAGANILVAGSAIFGAQDAGQMYTDLNTLAKEAVTC